MVTDSGWKFPDGNIGLLLGMEIKTEVKTSGITVCEARIQKRLYHALSVVSILGRDS